MNAPAFATGTSVSVEKTRLEIDVMLGKHGASTRGIAVDGVTNEALIGFTLGGGHTFRLRVPLPKLEDYRIGMWRGRRCTFDPARQKLAWEQATRERRRGALLLLRANLEAVRLGVLPAEQALAGIRVLPSGSTPQEMVLLEQHAGVGAASPKELGR